MSSIFIDNEKFSEWFRDIIPGISKDLDKARKRARTSSL